jgi:hypothetical protein
MTSKEAERVKLNAAFDEFYEAWDQQRENRGEPSPDEIGTAEGREMAELERAFRAGSEEEE